MVRRFLYSLMLIAILGSCGNDYEPLERYETTFDLMNDKTFIVGRWKLTRLNPTYDFDSWAKFCDDDTFSAYFSVPSAIYQSLSGTYTYSNGIVTCKAIRNDGSTSTWNLEFITIVGRNSINKAKLTYPDNTGSTKTITFELCEKQ